MVVDREFLKNVYHESVVKMKWHSDIEYKLLNMYLVVYPVIATVLLAIYELVKDKTTYLSITISLSIILTIFTILIHLKILREHKTYEKIGQQVVKIWKYFDLFQIGAYIPGEQIMDSTALTFGRGPGYKYTLGIFWTITIITDLILIISGILHYGYTI